MSGKTPSQRTGPVEPKTVGEALYWSYANLAMAFAYKRHSQPSYQQVDYIVRNKTYYGLLRGRLKMGSFLKDEQSKLRAAGKCSYCGGADCLSLDHLVPQFSGGSHSADNLVVSCRPCNSSKGKLDFLEWMAKRGQFPPLKLLRRYLKLGIAHCTANVLMDRPLQPEEALAGLPVSIRLLPFDFPEPAIFRAGGLISARPRAGCLPSSDSVSDTLKRSPHG